MLKQFFSNYSHLNLTHDIEDVNPIQVGGGAYSDVYRARMRLDPMARFDPLSEQLLAETSNSPQARVHGASQSTHVEIAIKRSRKWGELDPAEEKTVTKELKIWAGLSHSNILPLLGFMLNFQGNPYPSFISPWMEIGTLHKYMKKFPVEVIPMTCGIASGLQYLHSRGVIHADLKCENILLSPSLQPLLTDFGLSRQIITSLSGNPLSLNGPAGTMRWMAAEFFRSDLSEDVTVQPNEKTDIWAFGMTVLELMTKDVPYRPYKDLHMIRILNEGRLPLQPSDIDQYPYPAREIWSLCNECWRLEASMRPTIIQIQERLDEIKQISVSGSSVLRRVLHDLSHLNLTRDIVMNDSVPVDGGGFSDVFRSKMREGWQPTPNPYIQSLLYPEEASSSTTVPINQVKLGENPGNVLVAVKRFRIWGDPDPKIDKTIANELSIWTKLSHPNVLPILGYVLHWTGTTYPSLVSPWMENGTLRDYYMNRDNANIHIMTMAQGIISGLQYLHSQRVIHGDLKCANILLSPTLQPLLNGSGLSRQMLERDSASTSSLLHGGTLRWMAPELLSEEFGRANEQSDVWAFGMTLLELLTRDIPYKSINDARVIMNLVKGYLPPPPSNLSEHSTTDQYLWSICQECWMMDPSQRPIAVEIRNKLYQISGNEVT